MEHMNKCKEDPCCLLVVVVVVKWWVTGKEMKLKGLSCVVI